MQLLGAIGPYELTNGKMKQVREIYKDIMFMKAHASFVDVKVR